MQGPLLVAILSIVGYAAWIYVPWALVWGSYLAHVENALTTLQIIQPPQVKLTMITAAESGNLEYIKERVAANPNIINTELDFWHRGSLYWSSYYGHEEIVNYLLENGAEVNHRSETNWTALHAAAINNHIKIVRLLVEKGADLTVRDANDLSPRKLVEFFNVEEAAQVLLELEVSVLGKPFDYAPREDKEQGTLQDAKDIEEYIAQKKAASAQTE